MKKLFDAADRYIKTSDWKIVAVLKFCLISLGMMAGIMVKPRSRKAVFFGATCVFLASYIPLMIRFCKIFREKE